MITLRKKKLANGKFSLYLDIIQNKVRTTEFLSLYLDGGKNDKDKLRVAEEMRVKRESELINGTYISSRSMKVSFYDYYDKYSHTFFRKSEKDVLVQRMKKIRPRLSFEEINPVFWSELKTYLASLGNQPYTIHKAFGNLKAMVNNAIKLGLIPNTNLKQVTEKRPQTHREYLLKEELELLDRTPCRKPNVKNAFLFCCFTGLRFGDVKALTFASVQNNQIEIRQQKTGDYVYIPLSEQAKKYIPEFAGNLAEPLFGHLADGTVHAAIREWVATAGITKHVMFHTSRHTFATLALTYGVDIETVSSLLGHTSIKVTQIYAKIISKKKEEAVNKLPTL